MAYTRNPQTRPDDSPGGSTVRQGVKDQNSQAIDDVIVDLNIHSNNEDGRSHVQIDSELDAVKKVLPEAEAARDSAQESAVDAENAKDITLNELISIKEYGAVGDGSTDDLPAFNAAESAGDSNVRLKGTFRVSASPADQKISYSLTSESSVVPDSGAWNPRRYTKDGTEPFSRKLNPKSLNPSVQDGVYTDIEGSYSQNDFWVNQFGYQEADENGKLVGSFPSTGIPVGQSRLARTGSAQMRLRGNHSGEGDGYCHSATMATTKHGRSDIVESWSGQNSGGLYGGQANAITDKVNLYGIGDIALSDNAKDDVAMFGFSPVLTANGAESGAYAVPKVGIIVVSAGTNDIDCSVSTKGKQFVAIDLSQANVSSGTALALATGQKISFDAKVAPDGKFSTQDVGESWICKTDSSIVIAINGTESIKTFESHTDYSVKTQNAFSHRVYGADATPFASIGQIGANSYVSAASLGTDDTTLNLQTALNGVEAVHFKVKPNGILNCPTVPTYADNVTAKAGGLVAGDVYKTSAGDLKIVV